jgi:hypothetical protein
MLNIPPEIENAALRNFLSEFQRQINNEIDNLEKQTQDLRNKVNDNE